MGQSYRTLTERTKLLHAHYEDAIPLSLLKSEQSRIAREVAAAEQIIQTCGMELAQTERTVMEALDLAQDPERSYRQASLPTRRLYNQAVFEGIWVGRNKTIAKVTLTEPFARLLDQEFLARFTREKKNRTPTPYFRVRVQEKLPW